MTSTSDEEEEDVDDTEELDDIATKIMCSFRKFFWVKRKDLFI